MASNWEFATFSFLTFASKPRFALGLDELDDEEDPEEDEDDAPEESSDLPFALLWSVALLSPVAGVVVAGVVVAGVCAAARSVVSLSIVSAVVSMAGASAMARSVVSLSMVSAAVLAMAEASLPVFCLKPFFGEFSHPEPSGSSRPLAPQ